MPSDSSQNEPPSSSSRSQPPSRLINRSALASFTSPSSFPGPTPPSATRLRPVFNVERIYEFEAPQFYDFTKQSDPERGIIDENWFDYRKRTPSSPEFHFIAARTSSSATAHRPKSASGRLCHKGNFSGSNGGLSFMNTPVGRGQTFMIPSSVGADIRSSASYKPRAVLKKSATTECLLNSESSDPPSTIIRSCQKQIRDFGSDERKIISGFLSTPLLVIKTPGNVSRPSRKDLPRSPLQKVTKESILELCSNDDEGSSLLVKETSSIDDSISIKSNETILIEDTFKEPSSSIVLEEDSSKLLKSNLIKVTSSAASIRQEKEHESFQASVKARIQEERERIESQAALQSRKIQKLKAGPTNLPIKSTKPLTIPKEFSLGCDGRAQMKKLQAKPSSLNPDTSVKVTKPTIVQKFVPTVPKSPLFASKLRAQSKASTVITSTDNNENRPQVNTAAINLRRKLEYRPPTTKLTNVTIPKSPKLSSIHRNRLNNKN